MHVQVDVDQRAGPQPLAHRGRAVRRRGAARPARRTAPRTRRPTRPSRAAARGRGCAPKAVAQRGSDTSRSSWPVRVSASRELEQQPALALGQRLPRRRQARGHGHGPAGHRAQQQLRRRGAAARSGHDDVGPRQRTAPRSHRRADEAARDRAAACGSVGGEPVGREHRSRRHGQRGGQPPQRAQEQPQRRALLLGRVDDVDELAGVRVAGARQVGARRGSLVARRGRSAATRSRGGGEAGGAAVEAAEEQLDEPARHLGRDDALGRRVERADVERVRVAQRRGRRARSERLVDVDEVERRVSSRLLERRDTSTGSETDAAAAAKGERHASAPTPSTRHLACQRRPGPSRPGDHPRRSLDQLARIRRGESRPDGRAGELSEVAPRTVDLVVLLPGVGSDLRDREAAPRRTGAAPTEGRSTAPCSRSWLADRLRLLLPTFALLRPGQLPALRRTWR